MTTQLKTERKDAIAILTIDGAPWNIMTMAFMKKRDPKFNQSAD